MVLTTASDPQTLRGVLVDGQPLPLPSGTEITITVGDQKYTTVNMTLMADTLEVRAATADELTMIESAYLSGGESK